jgi:putative ABC transport system permease protein
MFDRDRWQEIFSALKKNKLRTALTAFGVFWGIFMLVIMLGSGNGLQNGVYNGMGGFATNSVFMWSQNTTVPYKGFKKGRWYSFTNQDTKSLKQQIPEIESIAPRLQARFWENEGQTNIVRGLKTGAFNIFGDVPEYNKIDPVNILKGRYINKEDIDRKRKVVVIGSRVADVLFEKDENPIGEYIQVRGVYFMVVGVFKSQHNGGWAEWQETTVEIPLTTLQQVYNFGDRVGWFAITSRSDVSVTQVEEEAKTILKKIHSVAPEDNEAIGSENVEKQFIKLRKMFTGIKALIWIVGIGTLLAGVIGVSNIMLIIVKERTKEIGIQRALGATPFNIISQIISESVFLTSIAGYLGLLLGVGVIEGLNLLLQKSQEAGAEVMFTRPEVDFNLAVTALTILIVCGAIAGFIPAKRAINVKPIEALRYE